VKSRIYFTAALSRLRVRCRFCAELFSPVGHLCPPTVGQLKPLQIIFKNCIMESWASPRSRTRHWMPCKISPSAARSLSILLGFITAAASSAASASAVSLAALAEAASMIAAASASASSFRHRKAERVQNGLELFLLLDSVPKLPVAHSLGFLRSDSERPDDGRYRVSEPEQLVRGFKLENHVSAPERHVAVPLPF
jgi:hypothetical protein